MEPNVAGNQSFFQTGNWKKNAQEYHGKRLVILELGVGWRNRMISKIQNGRGKGSAQQRFFGSVKKFVSLVKNDSFLVRIKI